MKAEAQNNEQSHYHGHRDRLRARSLENGPDALADYELLELILFSAIPRRDVKPLAKRLLATFGNLPALMNASIEDFTRIDGISDTTAILLKTMTAVSHRALKQDLLNRPVLNSWNRLIDYCTATMAHETREHFRILFLNKKNEMIADEIQGSGTVDHTPAYPREIMKRALELGATALILVHNHPSSDPNPSQADIDMTRAIMRAAEPFNIVIHDHLIIARGKHSSLKNQGFLA
jgi:DNA repair protein RadC